MKSYKIVALGASGAGKTVFLSSLYKELSTQGKYGFYVDVENLIFRIFHPTKADIKEGDITEKLKDGFGREICFIEGLVIRQQLENIWGNIQKIKYRQMSNLSVR
ncbi:hypothetical protein [Dolichospermum circinale]|uniref:hypothetical protein n=1 Tax=Dolichospermum circinale TaxID=109265 RepID=UPI00232C6D7C|nr:hypothetical protein [Dolichospermum circinale]MDB9451995.1 hypothetical protein [Dolichospermum circinale CS-547]